MSAQSHYSHYGTIVAAAGKNLEILRRLGDDDCAHCLLRMLDSHEAIAAALRARLAAIAPARTGCPDLDPNWPDTNGEARGPALCTSYPSCGCGDRDRKRSTVEALCHECSGVVEVVDGKLSPHHGETGDGCPQNGAVAIPELYLPDRVRDRISELEAELSLGARRSR